MRKRNEFVTSFWSRASKSLPASVRDRYKSQLKSAERFDLALDRAIELFTRRPAN